MWPFLGLLFLASPIDPSVLTVHIEPVVVDPVEVAKDAWIEKLHECENYDNIPKVLDTNGLYSYGYLQFQMKTWLNYGKDFGATKDNIGSSTLQKKVARSMLDAGGQNHWFNCSRRIGDYPAH